MFPDACATPWWASARAREETGGKGGEGRENLMQHRMCIVGSKAKTEGIRWEFPKSEAKTSDIINLAFLAPISA
jgi:hypothetical protein